MNEITTTGRSVSERVIYTKVGEQFSVTLSFAAGSWSGTTGAAQIRTDNGALIYTFPTPSVVVADDTSATLTFTAPSSATDDWAPGCYWVDFAWIQSGNAKMTKTFRVEISRGPTIP
jgi:hypothetical protein